MCVARRFRAGWCDRLRFSFDLQVLFYQVEGNYYANFLGIFLGWKCFGLWWLMDFGARWGVDRVAGVGERAEAKAEAEAEANAKAKAKAEAGDYLENGAGGCGLARERRGPSTPPPAMRLRKAPLRMTGWWGGGSVGKGKSEMRGFFAALRMTIHKEGCGQDDKA